MFVPFQMLQICMLHVKAHCVHDMAIVVGASERVIFVPGIIECMHQLAHDCRS